MRPTDKIERLISKTKYSADTVARNRILDDATAAMAKTQSSASAEPAIWRIIMKSKITKLAAAVIIAIIGVGMYMMTGSVDVSSSAFANVLKVVESTDTVVVHMYQKMKGVPEANSVVESDATSYFSTQYGSRVDMTISMKVLGQDVKQEMKMYFPQSQKEVISVSPTAKSYSRMHLSDELWKKNDTANNNPKNIVRSFMSEKYTSLGRSQINGVEVEGIEVNSPKLMAGIFGEGVGRLWIDVKTDLPVRVEIETHSKDQKTRMHMVMDDFQWGQDLRANVFEPNIPADYKLQAETKMNEPNESTVIEGLHTFAEASDGKYPSSMTIMTVIKEYKGYAVKRKGGTEPNQKAMQEFAEKMKDVSSMFGFYARLQADNKEPAYYGDKVTAEDANSVLMRWKTEDGMYRVIFGDLHTQTVTADQLAELEKPLQNQ